MEVGTKESDTVMDGARDADPSDDNGESGPEVEAYFQEPGI